MATLLLLCFIQCKLQNCYQGIAEIRPVCVNTCCLKRGGESLCTVLFFVSGLIKKFPPSHESRTKVYGCAGSGGLSWFKLYSYIYFSSHRSHNCDRSVQPNSQNPINKLKNVAKCFQTRCSNSTQWNCPRVLLHCKLDFYSLYCSTQGFFWVKLAVKHCAVRYGPTHGDGQCHNIMICYDL